MDTPLPKDRPANAIRLEDIQANILKPHGREYTWCLFIRFQPHPSLIRSWVSRFAGQVTSAAKQQKDAEHWRKKRSDGGTLVCFFLSAKGFQTLGFPENEMPEDLSFRIGMSNGHINGVLQDPVSAKWEPHYRKHIDGMILLADDNGNRLDDKRWEISRWLEEEGVGRVLFTEKGKKLTQGANPANLDHFGFHDNISQPEFFDQKGDLVAERLGIAVVEDGLLRGGSFLVFRKLEQNVQGFHQGIKKLAAQLGIPEKTDYVEAQVMGRFRDGTPLTLFDAPENHPTNNFGYADDLQGRKCPLHAHIRKCNPRGLSGSEDIRIVRRGVPYGYRKTDLSDRPQKDVGLLFMSYQASIAGQFEFIYKNWCNAVDFPFFDTGIDPLIGQQAIPDQIQNWNRAWDSDRRQKFFFSLREMISLKGGDYFFAPAIPWLEHTKNYDPQEAARTLLTGEPSPASSYARARDGYYLQRGIGYGAMR